MRNKLHTPFLPYVDTQHLKCEIFIFFVGGSQNSKKKYDFYILGIPKSTVGVDIQTSLNNRLE